MGEGLFIHTLFAALPAKAGIQIFVSKRCVEVWVPAFAGNAGWVGKQDPLRPFGPLPPKEEDLERKDLPPLGDVRA